MSNSSSSIWDYGLELLWPRSIVSSGLLGLLILFISFDDFTFGYITNDCASESFGTAAPFFNLDSGSAISTFLGILGLSVNILKLENDPGVLTLSIGPGRWYLMRVFSSKSLKSCGVSVSYPFCFFGSNRYLNYSSVILFNSFSSSVSTVSLVGDLVFKLLFLDKFVLLTSSVFRVLSLEESSWLCYLIMSRFLFATLRSSWNSYSSNLNWISWNSPYFFFIYLMLFIIAYSFLWSETEGLYTSWLFISRLIFFCWASHCCFVIFEASRPS